MISRKTKPELKSDVNTRSSYKLYKTLTDAPEDINTYLEIANDYIDFLMSKVHNGEEITLPARLGTLSITGSKRKLRFNDKGKPILPPDWRKTKALRDSDPQAMAEQKIVYCLNQHSGGVVYRFHWSKARIIIKNKTLYCLRLTRAHKRNLSDAVKQGREYEIKNR